MNRRTTLALAGIGLVAGLAMGACKESTSTPTCGSGTPPSLVGTYNLVSYTFGLSTVTAAQGASGQLRFQASTYGLTLTIPTQPVVVDSGSYSLNGVSCLTENSLLGNGSFTGTFALAGTTLTVSGTSSLGGAVGSVWTKQ
jgi:hypothetical protein